jgi:class 3 adenylate cyclase
MSGLIMHAVVYVVVNSLAVFAWMMTTGSRAQLEAYVEHPTEAFTPDFWPIYLIVIWGAALVIHGTAVAVRLLPGSRHRRRARTRRREKRATKQAEDQRSQNVAETGPARNWVVVMFTDISLSTPLTESMGDDAWVDVLTEHRTLVREHVDDHGGNEVSTQGDGFLVRFSEPERAAGCAVDLQRRLATRRASGTFTPEVRIGIHAGEVHQDDDDLVGSVVNLGARVVDAAGPGEILLTEPVADELGAGRQLTDAGLHDLKGLSRARHLLRLEWRDIAIEDELDTSSPGEPDTA